MSTEAGRASEGGEVGQTGLLDRYFGLAAAGTSIRTELVAGLTTFLTMAYILFVNPQVLSRAGMDPGAVFTATCLAAGASSAVMGLWANYPIALAPGMGLNAFFAFTLVLTDGFTWQQALAAVFCSGVIFLLISLFRLREVVVEAIPRDLKLAVAAGIGLFLGIIALETAGIVVAHPATLVTLGRLAAPAPVLALLGFALIVALNARGVTGGTLIGIAAVTALGVPFGLVHPAGIASWPPSLAPTAGQLDFGRAGELAFAVAVLSILFVDVFDNAGTLIGVTHRAGLLVEGRLPRLRQALVADSFAAMGGALLGTSTTTSYIESAAGVAAGGRTGLTAVTVAALFCLALFFAPLAGAVPAYATAAALLFVAVLMTRALADIAWDDATEAAPAVVTALAMPLTYSIATGIGLGFVTYVVIKLAAGRVREVTPAVAILAALFTARFALGSVG